MRTGAFTVRVGEQSHRVVIAADGSVTVDGGAPLAVTRAGLGVCLVDDGSLVRRAFVAGSEHQRQVFVDGEVFDLEVGPEAAGGRPRSRSAADLLSAPMPARVTAVGVEPGQAVRKGDVLVKLEAMKMEMAVRAPRDGTVTTVSCRVGELVQPGIGLLEDRMSAGTAVRDVRVVEVGPRDGLQNEPGSIATVDKVAFIDRLSAAGLPAIEVAAFVNPQRVPQMADGLEVARGLARHPGVTFSALVPNLIGLDRAKQAGIDEVAIFAAASETFSRANINQGIEDSLTAYATVVESARAAGIRVRGYLSACFGCPYEGPVNPARVASLAGRLLGMGVYEVVLGDTIGIAHPGQVKTVLALAAERVPLARVALHLHDTRGTALANVLVALERGVSTFDASAGGLGGCPFAPGAAGNLATEDLVYTLDGLGVRTGVDLAGVVAASRFIESRLDHPLPSRVYQAERREERRNGAAGD